MTELVAGAVIALKFKLERVIGKGGMGSVWAARHLQLDMPVALKFMDPLADTPDARVRFEREAKSAAGLRSPHVVQILDHGLDDGVPYIAMELLEGEDLGERLRRDKRISIQAASRILTQAAKALRRAHDVGTIHRDLKPSNIFLARFDDEEVVKLLDFGVAKQRVGSSFDPNDPGTQTGVVFGSPSYMSPEQARGVRVLDHKTDLWSMGVIMFRAITGVKPFVGDSIGDLVIKLCIDPLPIATHVAPDLPRSIDAFFERAFAREPEDRFASATLMAAEFESIASGSNVSRNASSEVATRPAMPAAMGGPTPASGSLLAPVSLTPGPSIVPASEMPTFSASPPYAAPPPIAPLFPAPSDGIQSLLVPRTGGSGPHTPSGPLSLSGPVYGGSGAHSGPQGLSPVSGQYGPPSSPSGPSGMGTAPPGWAPPVPRASMPSSPELQGMQHDHTPWDASRPGLTATELMTERLASAEAPPSITQPPASFTKFRRDFLATARDLLAKDGERRRFVLLGISGSVLIVLLIALVNAAYSARDSVAAPAAAPTASPANTVERPAPSPEPATAAPTAAPVPSASATASATVAASATAAPEPEHTAAPRINHPLTGHLPAAPASTASAKKHKPNFGY